MLETIKYSSCPPPVLLGPEKALPAAYLMLVGDCWLVVSMQCLDWPGESLILSFNTRNILQLSRWNWAIKTGNHWVFTAVATTDMDKISDVHLYNQETTRKGSMKIEVVVEEAKKPKRDRPGSASSIRNIEDIQKRQKVSMIMFRVPISFLSIIYF